MEIKDFGYVSLYDTYDMLSKLKMYNSALIKLAIIDTTSFYCDMDKATKCLYQVMFAINMFRILKDDGLCCIISSRFDFNDNHMVMLDTGFIHCDTKIIKLNGNTFYLQCYSKNQDIKKYFRLPSGEPTFFDTVYFLIVKYVSRGFDIVLNNINYLSSDFNADISDICMKLGFFCRTFIDNKEDFTVICDKVNNSMPEMILNYLR